MSEKKVSRKILNKFSFQEDFYSDLTVNNMLNAIIIRSPVKKGIVKSITHPDFPDGYYLFTARDVPGKNLIETKMGSIPIFSEGNISYLGEPLGILVGPDESVLQELSTSIEISFDSSPIESYLEFFEESTTPDTQDEQSVQLFSSKVAERKIETGPCFIEDKDGNIKGLKSVFDTAKYIAEGSWTYNLSIPYYNEPNGALCTFDKGTLTVYTPTQWVSSLRNMIQDSLNLKNEKINIKKTNSYDRRTNSIWYNSIIACQVAVASYHTGRGVKLMYTRSEQQKFIDTMLPVTITHKTAVDERGVITAMQIDIDMDAGSTNPFAQEILDRLVIASYGCYNPQNLSITAAAFTSQSPASSIDMQMIDSAAFFALENQIGEVCDVSGFTPQEIRNINFIDKETNRKDNHLPFVFNLPKITDTMNALLTVTDFSRKYASYHLDAVIRKQKKEFADSRPIFESPLRGIGLSTAFEGSCYYGSEIYNNDQTIEVTKEENGNITIHCPPISNSIQDIWKRLASSILDINASDIKVKSSFENNEILPLPEAAYSNISVMTQLLTKACETIKKQNKDVKLPYTVKRRISPSSKKNWNQETFSGTPFHSTASAAISVEVELDLCAYRENIREINLVINGGQILNETAAQKNIKLEIQKLLTSLVKDYSIDSDNIKIYFVKSNESPMQIGELVYQVLPSAYTQAISQALGCTINELPLETDRLYGRLEEQKSIEALKNLKLEEINNEDTSNN